MCELVHKESKHLGLCLFTELVPKLRTFEKEIDNDQSDVIVKRALREMRDV